METSAQISKIFSSVRRLEAPVYVLEGASMPALAIEAEFTQNTMKKLKDTKYGQKIARILYQGIVDYIENQKRQISTGIN